MGGARCALRPVARLALAVRAGGGVCVWRRPARPTPHTLIAVISYFHFLCHVRDCKVPNSLVPDPVAQVRKDQD